MESNACLRSFQDYSGNLWVGMQNRIALIHLNSPMRFLNQEINIQGSGYEAFETVDGTYFTTSNGIYFPGKERRSRCISARYGKYWLTALMKSPGNYMQGTTQAYFFWKMPLNPTHSRIQMVYGR
ncbi:MAG: hypothetical protein H6573_30000 [Lewinellaceae bacterium]|nr:hypothetical protein [Lewinellaceae bacterium]